MSASLPETCIFTTDSPEVAEKKIRDAFTGGRPTVEEQRLLGGDPFSCPIYHYEYYLFEEDDDKLKETRKECRCGELLCGEHKNMLAEKVKAFLRDHQKKREKAKDVLNDFLFENS
jgi:tryptophanyl-tRNA synthetase